MPSPFPGMDPYLENPAYWPDFHSRFVNSWCEAVADALPPNYEASIGERIYLMGDEPETRKMVQADVAVSHERDFRNGGGTATATLTTLEPVTIPIAMLDGPSEPYIEILHQPERSLVAVLELLSPANKEQPGRTQYLVKRQALIYQDVHLVELDLLRGGQRLPMEKPLPAGDCYYLLARAEQRPDCQVYYWTYRQPLPTLTVPLRSPDPDIAIDLAAVLTTSYDRGRFGRRLRYDGPIPFQASKSEEEWMQTVLTKNLPNTKKTGE